MPNLPVSFCNTIDEPAIAERILSEFEARSKVKVELTILNWEQAWKEFIQISLYRRGPVVSECGETWMGSLASRNCLRAFTTRDLAQIGGKGVFLDSIWENSLDFDGQTVIGIPWTLDTYMLYYRRDMLAAARIPEDEAFGSLEALYATLEKLVAAGHEIPLAIPTSGDTTSLIHNAASWVWARGGDFISPDGRLVTFSEPRTLAGLREYFELHRFMPPAARGLDDTRCDELIEAGKVAVTLRFVSLLNSLRHQPAGAPNREMDVALLPAPPFVGGQTLVVWKHILPEQEATATDLIRFLTSTATGHMLFKEAGLVPARLEALAEVEKDPHYAVLIRSLQRGRGFPRARLWGLIEERLIHALNETWQRVFAVTDPDIDAILAETILPVEDRLNMTLSQ